MPATLWLAANAALAAPWPPALPVRPPLSLTEAFVAAWMPEFAEFNPPAGSIHARLRSVAQAGVDGRMKEAELELSELLQSKLAPAEKAAVELWKVALAERRGEWPFGAFGFDPRSSAVRVRAADTYQAVQKHVEAYAKTLPAGKGRDDVFCALDYEHTYIGELEMRGATYERVRALNPTLADVTQTPQRKFLEGQAWAKRNNILPPATLQLLEHEVLGRIATGQGNGESARTHFEAGLKVARAHKLGRAEIAFLLRLGDLALGTRGDVETFGMSMGEWLEVRAAMSAGRRLPSGTPPPNPTLAETHYRQASETLTRLGHGGDTAPVLLRKAILEHFARRHEGLLQGCAAAAETAERDGQATLAALSLATQSFFTLDRQQLGRAILKMESAGYEGGVSVLLAYAKNMSKARYLYNDEPLEALAQIRMARLAFRESGFASEAGELLPEEAEACLEIGQLDAALSLFADERSLSDFLATLGTPSPTDTAHLASPVRGNAFALIQRLAYAADNARRNEGQSMILAARWGGAREGFMKHLRNLAAGPADTQQIERMLQEFEISDATVEVGRARGTPDFPAALEKVRTLAGRVKMGDLLMINLLTAAVEAMPELKPDLRRRLEHARPIEGFIAADEKVRQLPPHLTADAVREAHGAMALCNSAIAGAIAIDAVELLEIWLGQLEKTTAAPSPDPDRTTWNQVQHQLNDRLRALVALQRGDAVRAREYFEKVVRATGYPLDGVAPAGPLPMPPLPLLQRRQAVIGILSDLVESEAVAGDRPERGLLTAEAARQLAESMRPFTTPFQSDHPASAQLAMLNRKAAMSGALSPEEAKVRRRLEAELPPTQAAAVGAPPTRENLDRFRAQLPAGASVLTYFVGMRSVVGWCIRADGVQMKRLALSPGTLMALRQRLRGELMNNEAWRDDAAELWRCIVEPFGPFAPEAPLIVVANHVTAGIPVEVLGPDPEHALIRERPVVYARTLALGSMPPAAREPASARATPALVAGCNGIGLREAEPEARVVADLLQTKPFLGADACKPPLAEAMRKARWIHLATHGKVSAENPYNSFLTLADGPVQAWEFLTLAAAADTVVLSACDTNTSGARQAAGLSEDSISIAAFAMAPSARWVAATLWRTDDAATSRLVGEFYRGIFERGQSRAEALRAAKVLLLQGRPEEMAPASWAAMILMVRDPSVLLSE